MSPYDYDSIVTTTGEWHIPAYLRSTTTETVAPAQTHLYGLCGFIGSGKNTAAQSLLAYTQGESHSFAGPLKDACAAIFGWPRNLLEGDTEASRQWRDTTSVHWSRVFGRHVTPRQVLQEVGTEVFRAYLPNVWCEAAANRVRTNTTTVFTDVRFGNEMSWIDKQDGMLIWIYRPDESRRPGVLGALIATIIAEHRSFNDPDTIPLLKMAAIADGRHSSETAFLYDGDSRIHVIVQNTSSPAHLAMMMQHMHILRITRQLGSANELPYGATTLYLSVVDEHFLWQWNESQQKTFPLPLTHA